MNNSQPTPSPMEDKSVYEYKTPYMKGVIAFNAAVRKVYSELQQLESEE